ncbi:hypothetical protein CONPUDRAFT_135251 [Coniophora puteana RWD-64-598 SS2]|uniref:Uncharacterized protein n=1 Tax=Coniophora puteana (strain RWD-64-598) TaxID=741705 RepID=A0A5M3N2E6_CONPW|nr:uncharacterized protein CONPUDRAFT_135251 [Coniophora puteana RWD-64-598 SS2]EIW85553.1 hypothetical protein CONPUDRAFT_135251 [Coniophora puteana RWD-64-598 SS2]
MKPSGDAQAAPRSPPTRSRRLPYYSGASRALATPREGILRQGGWIDGLSSSTRDRVTKRMRTKLVKAGDGVTADSSSAYPTPRPRRNTAPGSPRAPLPSSSAHQNPNSNPKPDPPPEPVASAPLSVLGRTLRSRAKSASQPTLEDPQPEERRTTLMNRRTRSEVEIGETPRAPSNAASNEAPPSSTKTDTATTATAVEQERERPQRTYARSQQPSQTAAAAPPLSPSKQVFSRPRTTGSCPDPPPSRSMGPPPVPNRELMESTPRPPRYVEHDETARMQHEALEMETRQLMEEYEKVMAEQRQLKEKLQARIKKEKEYNAQLRRLLKEA